MQKGWGHGIISTDIIPAPNEESAQQEQQSCDMASQKASHNIDRYYTSAERRECATRAAEI